MSKIKLPRGKYALVDDSDFERVNQFKWCCTKHGHTYYAHRTIRTSPTTHIKIYLHRFILNSPKGKEVDHINRNALDNRRENLRHVTSFQNKLNQRIRKDSPLGIQGVRIRYGKYSSRFRGKSLGIFDTAQEASKVYQETKALCYQK